MIKETSSNQPFRRDSENRMVRFLSPSVYYNVDPIVPSHLFTVSTNMPPQLEYHCTISVSTHKNTQCRNHTTTIYHNDVTAGSEITPFN